MKYTLDYEKLLSCISIPEINENCRFWMLRTKEGFFYDEFVSQRFIAIGWNIITKDILTEKKEEDLKLLIEHNYPQNKKVPGNALNKCKRFIHELQVNDIILIIGNYEISFAKIGEYFEDENPSWTATKELEIHKQIETRTLPEGVPFCPYKKRRKIEIIRTISISSITPILYKVLAANRHSLSEIKEYKDAVLESCYDIFKYKGKLSLVLHIDKKTPINSRDFSEFFNIISRLLPYETYAKASVHSPGEVIFNIYKWIQEESSTLILIFIILGGGSIGSIEMPSLMNTVFKVMNYKRDSKSKDLANDEKEVEIQIKKIEKERLQTALEKDKIENQKAKVTLEKERIELFKQLKKYSNKLEVRPTDSNIFNLAEYRNKIEKNEIESDSKV